MFISETVKRQRYETLASHRRGCCARFRRPCRRKARHGPWKRPRLATETPPCGPPGIATQQFGIGQRFAPSGFSPYAYNQIPYDLRSQYGLNPYNRYYYGNGYLYGVNPRTMLVQQVIGALLGRY